MAQKSNSKQTLPGLNIQWPISELILNGKKTIETRTYPLPPKYVGRELLLVETPGRTGKFRARIVAKIVFGESFKYSGHDQFYRDVSKHCVDPKSPWAWNSRKGKWGWPIRRVVCLDPCRMAPAKRGIVFCKIELIQAPLCLPSKRERAEDPLQLQP